MEEFNDNIWATSCYLGNYLLNIWPHVLFSVGKQGGYKIPDWW